MARKILYLGNSKWCYTENCEQHAVLIDVCNKYREAFQKQDTETITRLTSEHSTTPEGVAALRHVLISELTKTLGRKPTVGLDIDGTTGNFTAGLRAHMISKSPIKIEKSRWLEKFPEPDTYDYFDGEKPWFNSREEFLQNFQEAEVNGIYRKMTILPGAKATLDELTNLGFKIKVVTARTAFFNKDTSQWLKDHAVPHTHLYNTGHEKEKVADIDVYIDDAPVVIKRLIAHEKKVLIMGQGYNKDIFSETGNNIRVDSWKDNVIDNILSLLIKK